MMNDEHNKSRAHSAFIVLRSSFSGTDGGI